MKPPRFWREGGPLSLLLAPAGALYGAAGSLRRRFVRPVRAPVRVICIGNLTAGGAGKTPVAMALGEYLLAREKAVHVLSRGYRGALAGPVRVDPARHDAAAVGDEPLLLARVAPTWVARDRVAGARAAASAGADVVIMDDGHQNPTLHKDLSLVVVDGGYGFGNGRVMPAGPLREPVAAGLARADAVLLITPDSARVAAVLPPRLPLLHAALAPTNVPPVAGRTVVAFAGIGRPEKFFATLEAMKCRIVARLAFADHHRFAAGELDRILAQARAADALAVTTEKDYVRLPAAIRAAVQPVPIALVWRDSARLEELLQAAGILG